MYETEIEGLVPKPDLKHVARFETRAGEKLSRVADILFTQVEPGVVNQTAQAKRIDEAIIIRRPAGWLQHRNPPGPFSRQQLLPEQLKSNQTRICQSSPAGLRLCLIQGPADVVRHRQPFCLRWQARKRFCDEVWNLQPCGAVCSL